MKKCKISAPFFSGLKMIKTTATTGGELSADMEKQLGRGIDFGNFTAVVNGSAIKVNDPLPSASALMIEISESENESGLG